MCEYFCDFNLLKVNVTSQRRRRCLMWSASGVFRAAAAWRCSCRLHGSVRSKPFWYLGSCCQTQIRISMTVWPLTFFLSCHFLFLEMLSFHKISWMSSSWCHKLVNETWLKCHDRLQPMTTGSEAWWTCFLQILKHRLDSDVTFVFSQKASHIDTSTALWLDETNPQNCTRQLSLLQETKEDGVDLFGRHPSNCLCFCGLNLKAATIPSCAVGQRRRRSMFSIFEQCCDSVLRCRAYVG